MNIFKRLFLFLFSRNEPHIELHDERRQMFYKHSPETELQ